jgi:hypothetical protein
MGQKYVIEVVEKDHGLTVGIIILAVIGLIAWGSANKGNHNNTPTHSQSSHYSAR